MLNFRIILLSLLYLSIKEIDPEKINNNSESMVKNVSCEIFHNNNKTHVKNLTYCNNTGPLEVMFEGTFVTLLSNNVKNNLENYKIEGFNVDSRNVSHVPYFDDEISQRMRFLSIKNCRLKIITPVSLKRLPKLVVINFLSNLIENLEAHLFDNNPELIAIALGHNKIKFINANVFCKLEKLEFLELSKNVCFNETLKNTTEISKGIHNIRMMCSNNTDCNDLKDRVEKIEIINIIFLILISIGIIMIIFKKFCLQREKNLLNPKIKPSRQVVPPNISMNRKAIGKSFETIDLGDDDSYSNVKDAIGRETNNASNEYQELDNFSANKIACKDNKTVENDYQSIEEENVTKKAMNEEEIYSEVCTNVEIETENVQDEYASIKQKNC